MGPAKVSTVECSPGQNNERCYHQVGGIPV